ncbi:tRNA (guanosine(37)-N1)-methyltransferase TrmD [Oscillospiraceae bacterium OttesenSCG-928-G22]|nr:tRNA (guanosine(37)-N1)-methyltransferase TrmD [Oscillospiraceae bacterium OttesenSCG-928-G22]
MRIDILTLFPDMVQRVMDESIVGRAQDRGFLVVRAHNIRDYTMSKQNQVDDYPYGGGSGALLMADPLYRCLEAVKAMAEGDAHVVYLSPCGPVYRQATAKRLAMLPRLILVCGHYEGVDERFIEECVDEEISLGDFVVTGGEIPAMAVCDSVARLVPGVLASEESYMGESHWTGLLEHPHYTRPEVWHGRPVPEELLSGDHQSVDEWRRRESLRRTYLRRPDLLETAELSEADRRALRGIRRESEMDA